MRDNDAPIGPALGWVIGFCAGMLTMLLVFVLIVAFQL